MRLFRFFFFILFFIIPATSTCQLPDTDLFLASLKKENDAWSFGKPINITNRKGYDNQPCFTPDGKGLLYVSLVDTTQSDVYRYDFHSQKSVVITRTTESEYSPAYTPYGKNISVVRVDRDSGQRFYSLPLHNISDAKQIEGTDSIGYACWLNDSLLAMFILGPSNTLRILNIHTGKKTLIAADIGRCLKLSPDHQSLYFVIKGNETEWFIYSMRISDVKLERIIQTISGSEDFAILQDETLLLGSEGILYSYLPKKDTTWNKAADFTETLKSFYRISVSPSGDRMVLVAYTGKKP